MAELLLLAQSDPAEIETTLIVLPRLLQDFTEYNAFGEVLDGILAGLQLQGIVQIATFHPDYRFADLQQDDVRNYTNRSPYPLFHLIRESSVSQAREHYPDIESIPENNMRKLLEIGLETVCNTFPGAKP